MDTLGLLYLDGMLEGYTLERPDKGNKRRVSRIPAGVYPVRYRKELTPMTIDYRKRYDWFTWHLEVCEVPNRDYIYIHPANKVIELAGCIGIGDRVNNNEIAAGFIYPSEPAFERIYKKISAKLDEMTATDDRDVFVPITITDEHFIR